MPETKRHLQLKDLALAWLRAVGCRAVATEVACPFHRYRFDALGWLDHADDARAVEAFGAPAADPRAPRTIAVECKQSRADFASDDADPAELVRRKAYLLERRSVIEELRVKVRETHLRDDQSSLFEELATWEFGASRIAAYRKVLDELAAIDAKMGIDTKFAQLTRWRTADHLVLVAPSGLLRPREVPAGWGLVEVEPRALRKGWEPVAGEPLPCTMRVAPAALGTPEERRVRLLRNIAVAACRGVGYGLIPPKPREHTVLPPSPAPDAPGLFSLDPSAAADTMKDHEPR
ncbi:MAG: hypothetical protein GC172_04550 [Phycisphaera sp.]|nr:hypothetical protein [Phycisphaera sp.]